MERIVFVLCKDYGELLVADYFVRGQGFDAHFICPDNLFQAYDGEQARLHEYGNINELRRHLRAIDPEFVVFASGYLLCHHGLLAQEEFTELLDELRRSGVGAMTTDPWMKSWSDGPGANGFPGQVHSRFLALQRALESALEDLPHLYTVPFESRSIRTLSFVNAGAFTDGQAVDGGRSMQDPRRWLFVLSGMDYRGTPKENSQRFYRSLNRRFLEVLDCDANASIVFIAPAHCLDRLKPELHANARVELVPHCGFSRFRSYLLGSGISVYWNMLSASILYRAGAGGALFIAERGHMISACRPLYERALEYGYNGEMPSAIDMDSPLPDEFEEKIKLSTGRISALGTHLCRQPSPREILSMVRRS